MVVLDSDSWLYIGSNLVGLLVGKKEGLDTKENGLISKVSLGMY